MLAAHGFGMELHALETTMRRELAVANAHDLAVLRPGRHFQSGRQRFALDGERVVARGGEGAGQAAEDARVGVMHRGSLAMHELAGMHDPAAEGGADRLVAEADAEQRQLAGEGLDRRHRDAGLGRRAGSGEITIRSGFRAAIPSTVISSLRKTRTSSPSSPKYCTRL